MRRNSDAQQGQRTGLGRRTRDRLAAGDAVSPSLAGPRAPQSTLFLGEDLREAALALAGVEAYVIRAHLALAQPSPSPGELAALASDREVAGKLELLADALASLRRTLGSMAQERQQADALP